MGKPKIEPNIWISEHKTNIRNNDEKSPVARHFNTVGNDMCSLRFWSIENNLEREVVIEIEAFWIHTLQTEYPRGLNEELLLGCCVMIWGVMYVVIFYRGCVFTPVCVCICLR